MIDKNKLIRLERLMDVIYALLVFRMFRLIPGVDQITADLNTVSTVLFGNFLDLLIILISLVFVIIYWNQNNGLFGKLKGTDSTHTAISILQMFCLLLFLYSIRMGSKLDPNVETRLLESVTAALVGYMSVLGWVYALRKRKLLKDSVSDKDARRTLKLILSEPLAATLTIPCAFIGPVVWEIAWLSFIPFAQIPRRILREDD